VVVRSAVTGPDSNRI